MTSAVRLPPESIAISPKTSPGPSDPMTSPRDQRGTLAPINACRRLGAVAHLGDLLAQLDEDKRSPWQEVRADLKWFLTGWASDTRDRCFRQPSERARKLARRYRLGRNSG